MTRDRLIRRLRRKGELPSPAGLEILQQIKAGTATLWTDNNGNYWIDTRHEARCLQPRAVEALIRHAWVMFGPQVGHKTRLDLTMRGEHTITRMTELDRG